MTTDIPPKRKVIIIGGVAGGANAAARLRRLSEELEIVMFERGPYVSFANCGLPYHIGGEIAERSKLLLHTPESLGQRFNLEVKVNSEVVKIDPSNKKVFVRHNPPKNKQKTSEDEKDAQQTEHAYDHLIIATGSSPIKPPLPGLDLPGVFALRDMVDMDRIIEWGAKLGQGTNNIRLPRAVIVGAGFIGCELAEQLVHRGYKVAIIDADKQVIPPLDAEMAAGLANELQSNGVEIHLSQPLTGVFAKASNEATNKSHNNLEVRTAGGLTLSADMVIVGIGVRPESSLARAAGLSLGQRGGVLVNEYLQTSDPHIWAVGDCIEFPHAISKEVTFVPMASPANRQGRLVADNVFSEIYPSEVQGNQAVQTVQTVQTVQVVQTTKQPYCGPLGTAVVRVFSLVAACTGLNEKTLKRLNRSYVAEYLHPNSHAGYFPGAHPINLKLLFDPQTGEILGAQAVGKDGVDKRIDVIATAIMAKLKVEDLADLELCYAPPIGSAKDAVNMAGMIGENIRLGRVKTITPAELEAINNLSADPNSAPFGSNQVNEPLQVVDVRDAKEREKGAIPNSLHIPLNELRSRLSELPKGRRLAISCQSGQRAYYACRILSQAGFDCVNLSGAYKSWSEFQQSR